MTLEPNATPVSPAEMAKRLTDAKRWVDELLAEHGGEPGEGLYSKVPGRCICGSGTQAMDCPERYDLNLLRGALNGEGYNPEYAPVARRVGQILRKVAAHGKGILP